MPATMHQGCIVMQAHFVHSMHKGCKPRLPAMAGALVLRERDFHTQAGFRLRMLIQALIDCGRIESFAQAAKHMETTASHLGNWMRGRPMRPYHLYRFCRRHGVTFDWVFLGDPSGLPEPVLSLVMKQEQHQAAE
jgi:hypothetical protein